METGASVLGMVPVMQKIINHLTKFQDVVHLSCVCRSSRFSVFTVLKGPPPLFLDEFPFQRHGPMAPLTCCSRGRYLNSVIRANTSYFATHFVSFCGSNCFNSIMEVSTNILLDILVVLRNRGSGGEFAKPLIKTQIDALILSETCRTPSERIDLEDSVRRSISRITKHDWASWVHIKENPVSL